MPPNAAVPWIDATPPPSPTPEPTADPRSVAQCVSSDVVLEAGGWSGATGSLAGGASVTNLAAEPCVVTGFPAVDLLDADGRVVASTSAHGGGDGEPPLVVLPSGGVAGVLVVWSNWCGVPPKGPLSMRATAPGWQAALTAEVRERQSGPGSETPRCDNPGGGSHLGVPEPFSAPEASAGGYEPGACSADSLTAYLGPWGAAGGTSYSHIVARNDGATDCLLPAAPPFELRDASGRSVLATEPTPLPSSGTTILVPPGWAAVATIGFANWCGAPPATPLGGDLVIGPDRLGVVPRSPIPVPACMSGAGTPRATLFYERPFVTPGTPSPPEANPVDSLPVSVALPDLPTAKAGSTVEYVVTLTNIGQFAKPISLDALCPSYTQRLILPGSTRTIETHFALNCAAVGVLEPQEPVSFAMRLAIPPDAPPGEATLVWQLGDRGPAAKRSLQIE